MAFTRFHDDPSRVIKSNLETSSINDYMFNIPSNTNNKNVYIDDPHIRLQKNGNSQYSNLVGLEGELRYSNQGLTRDYIQSQYNRRTINHNSRKLEISNLNNGITDESRSTHPAWTFRTLQQYRPEHLFEDPQKNFALKFENNVDTNIETKDNYKKHHKKI